MKNSINYRRIAAIALFVWGLNAGAASATTITLGGFTFDATAFPTAASFVSGGPANFSFPTTGTVNGDLLKATDSDLTSYMFGPPVDFTVTFGNGALQNRSGADFVIFELGGVDNVSVKVGSTINTYLTVFTNTSAVNTNLNAIAIDLSDFGIASNDLVSSLEISNASGASSVSASIDAIGGLNTASSSVPEPATYASLAGGLALLGLCRRRLPGLRS